MEEQSFDATAIRKALNPRLSRLELSKKMGISYSYMRALENGYVKWPDSRKAKFFEVINAWQSTPSPSPRKRRCDAGKKHTKFRRMMSRRKEAPTAEFAPAVMDHGVMTGIG